MIKAIIFDCWNTLYFTDLKPHHFVTFAERIGKDFLDYKFMKLFEKHFMLEKHYELEMPIEELLKELNIDYSDESVRELKNNLIEGSNHTKAYPETSKILKKLKDRYKLGMISNTDYLSFKQLNELFKLDEIFDVILKSYETRMLKPDPKIFALMLNKLKVTKQEVIIVGDSIQDDIKAAENFGIKGILLDRKNKFHDYPNRIISLEQLDCFL